MPDTRLYSDYLCMIEVPMYLQMIRQRLQNNYYTNKNSVVSDMELIKENCYKYNEDDNEFYALACEMHINFKELVNAIPDDCADDDPNDSDHETTIRRGVGVSQGGGVAAVTGSSTQRSPNRSRRRLSQQVSSLANLPNSGERSLRRSTRSTNTTNNPSETVRGPEGSEEVSSQQPHNPRSGRNSRQSQDEVNNQEESQATRRSSRSRARMRYTDAESEPEEESNTESEEEEEENFKPNKPARASRTSDRSRRDRSRQRSNYTDEESELEEEEEVQEEEVQPTRKPRSRSNRHNSKPDDVAYATRTSERSRRTTSYTLDNAVELEDDEPPRLTRAKRREVIHNENNARGSNRTSRSRGVLKVAPSPTNGRQSSERRRRKRHCSEDENSEDYTESGAEQSDDYEESPAPKKQTKLRVRVAKQTRKNTSPKKGPPSPSNHTRSSRQRTEVSYTDVGSDIDQYVEGSDEEVSDIDITPKKKRSRSQSKSIAYNEGTESPQKKRGRGSTSRK